MGEKVSAAGEEQRSGRRCGRTRGVSSSSSSSASSSSSGSGSQTLSEEEEEGEAATTSAPPAAAGQLGTAGSCFAQADAPRRSTPEPQGVATMLAFPLGRGTTERDGDAAAGQPHRSRRESEEEQEEEGGAGGGDRGHLRPKSDASLEEQDEEVRRGGADEPGVRFPDRAKGAGLEGEREGAAAPWEPRGEQGPHGTGSGRPPCRAQPSPAQSCLARASREGAAKPSPAQPAQRGSRLGFLFADESLPLSLSL